MKDCNEDDNEASGFCFRLVSGRQMNQWGIIGSTLVGWIKDCEKMTYRGEDGVYVCY
jgi:hypothetical protein